MNKISIFLNIVEIRTKAVSLSTLAIAVISAAVFLKNNGQPFPWVNWWLMFAAALAVDMGTTGFNTFFDFLHGVDYIEGNYEEAKVLVHRGVSPAEAFYSSLILFFIAVVLGLVITFRTSWLVAAAGAVCMAAGFFYSAGRRPISYTPFGELISGGFLGSVLFCICWYVVTGQLPLAALLISVPVSLMISGILTVNNNCDLENDRKAGRKTLSILFGLRTGRIILYCEYALAVLMFLLMQYRFRIIPAGNIFISTLIIVLMIFQFVRMHRRGFNAKTKGPSMQSILQIFLTGSLLQLYPWLAELLS